jgi:hypothetical protein
MKIDLTTLVYEYEMEMPGRNDSGPLVWEKIAEHTKKTRIQERKVIKEYPKPFTEHGNPPIAKKLAISFLTTMTDEYQRNRG